MAHRFFRRGGRAGASATVAHPLGPCSSRTSPGVEADATPEIERQVLRDDEILFK